MNEEELIREITEHIQRCTPLKEAEERAKQFANHALYKKKLS
jgi:hypothetical protein